MHLELLITHLWIITLLYELAHSPLLIKLLLEQRSQAGHVLLAPQSVDSKTLHREWRCALFRSRHVSLLTHFLILFIIIYLQLYEVQRGWYIINLLDPCQDHHSVTLTRSGPTDVNSIRYPDWPLKHFMEKNKKNQRGSTCRNRKDL